MREPEGNGVAERGMEAFYDGPGLSCPARSSRPPRAPRSCTSRRRPRPRELTVQKGELFVLQSRAGKRSAPRCCCADRPDRGAGSRSCTGATQIPGPAQRRRLRGGRRLHDQRCRRGCMQLPAARAAARSSMQASAEPPRPEEADHPLNVAALAVARDGRGYFSLNHLKCQAKVLFIFTRGADSGHARTRGQWRRRARHGGVLRRTWSILSCS